ncbi:uncharacterized protein MYCFIDRAFT_149994 [Pseudocercospora fijiensis CIRAD86]|uniref:Uncharacterized protein n=1 Tax=Pseudocercospora fijiensis (strain CIRAD86) TaxID=383855 RepID=N1QCV6_PSEFD|nr:uncharacterized protein MYCFIDRAFT_149994 [Pseudocercospora fijiensis CIRAD86]EME89383.1 hypothetical protein MYCFIDRAFT_149994 [Pseudocercospora fijiensis CIRAD86]
MVAVNQTITIVNKGGKIVSTSKHLVNVFTEAKGAYNERKAEIKAQRKSDLEAKERERKARKQLEALTLVDDEDDSASQRASRRGSDDGRSVNRKPVPPRRSQRPPPEIKELTRRNTDGMQLQSNGLSRRRVSLDDIDMDLAYGELPPPLPESRVEDEIELRSKMTYLQRLLDEGNCVQHSVTAMIDNLQKNPDALAAVALTLGEIANLAAKMAPGALATMKTSFPAIIALLASPQFAIAAGVGVGVTIIAFGSYKIIKKIKAKNSAERLLENAVEAQAASADEDVDELRELDSIEKWRRGIADEAANSMGTSVDGEFITPVATRTLIEEGKLTEADFKPLEGKSKKTKSRKAKSDVSSSTRRSKGDKVKVKAKKEPSILRNLFKGHS